MAQLAAGEQSWKRSPLSNARTVSRSSGRKARAEYRRLPVEARASHAEGIASRLDADGGTEIGDGLHQSSSGKSGVANVRPNSVATFF